MYTDPKRVRADIPGTVEGNPVFQYHDAFNADTAEVDDLKDRYRRGAVGDVEVKRKLARALNAFLDPIRERRAAYAADPERIEAIIDAGNARMRREARETMERYITPWGEVRGSGRRVLPAPEPDTTFPPMAKKKFKRRSRSSSTDHSLALLAAGDFLRELISNASTRWTSSSLTLTEDIQGLPVRARIDVEFDDKEGRAVGPTPDRHGRRESWPRTWARSPAPHAPLPGDAKEVPRPTPT